ncbi:Mur ligase family protein, partial [candidate division KSB1 bacterium]
MVDVKELYEIFKKYPLISTDSRNIQKNSVFFGLKGENFNGNEYVLNALKNGAAYAVTDSKSFADNNRCLIVNDTLEALQQLAAIHRKQFNIPVIALTGTNGKTTTKELISSVLKKKYKILATKGNLNNHIGVPL